MDRYSIYKQLRENINGLDNSSDFKEKIEVMLSPIYLWTISCLENNIEQRFMDLSFIQKLSVIPRKLADKLGLLRVNIELTFVTGLNRKDANRYRIIFFPVEVTHLKQMIPVSTYLPKGEYMYITNRLKIYLELVKQGIPCRFIHGGKGAAFSEFDYSKLGQGIIPKDRMEVWSNYCKNLIDRSFYNLHEGISTAIKLLNPTKVVVGYDITPEGRLCAILCKRLKIKTLSIQHGSIAGEPLDSEHIVDSYLVYGERAKKYLTEINRSSTSFEVFGAPYLDTEMHYVESRENALGKLRLNPANKTVLVALSGPGHCTTYDHFIKIVGSLVKLSSEHENINVVFKLHRKDKLENYYPIFKMFNFSCPIIKANDKRFSSDIFFWLQRVDILVTGSSAVALEAMLLQKPVLTIDYHNEYRDVDFIDSNCTIHVTDEAVLFEKLSGALFNSNLNEYKRIAEQAKDYINGYFYTEEISASQRIAESLMS